MSDLKCLCCICLQSTDVVSTLDNTDLNSVKYIKKLIFCVPNETWKAHYQICSSCICQLDVVYRFVQYCVESQEFRKEKLEGLEKPQEDLDNSFARDEKFTCDHCGKSFRQKRYLSQHITKLHINKKQRESGKKSAKNGEDAPEVKVQDSNNCLEDVKPEITDVVLKEDYPIDEEQNKENTAKQLGQENECKSDIKSDPSDDDNLGDITDIGNDDVAQDATFSEKSEIDDDFLDEKPMKRSHQRKNGKREPQQCRFCNEVFKKRQDWAAHIRLQHTFEKPFSCDQCDARYMNRYSLQIHSRKHKNEKPFICATCGKSFVSSADLNHHTKIHNKNRAYPCPMCDRSFKTHSNLRTHRLQMHLDPAEWKFPCHLCDKKFPIRGNLMKHLKRHAGIKEFNCHICEKKFVNKAEMTLHLNTHTNQRLFKCGLCGKDYKNREGLRRHMKVIHDQGNWKAPKIDKKYLCPMCPKIFAFGNKLQRHIFTHTGEKPFKCDYCQKRFIDNYGRKVHYKKDHDIEFCC